MTMKSIIGEYNKAGIWGGFLSVFGHIGEFIID